MPTPPPPELLRELLAWVELLGVALCAVSGALLAARKNMDYFGFVVVGTATALGGGTLRDLVLGLTPVFWAASPKFLLAGAGAALATFWLARFFTSKARALLWFDAAGMAMFTITGAEKSLLAGAAPPIAVAMGVMTACFGGVIRDILCGDRPLLLHAEIYATASLAGALAFVGLAHWDNGLLLAEWTGFLTAFVVRGGAIHWKWSFPPYGGRAQ